MADDGLDRASSPPPSEQRPRLAFPEPVHDLHIALAPVVVSSVSEVAVGMLRLHAANLFRLFQHLGKRVPIVRVARKRHRAEDPVRARCRDEARLDAELVALVDFPLGDALDLRLVDGIDLVPAGRALVLRDDLAG